MGGILILKILPPSNIKHGTSKAAAFKENAIECKQKSVRFSSFSLPNP